MKRKPHAAEARMFFGIRQLRRSAALLSNASSPSDDAVPEAIFSFLSACSCYRDWPEAFRRRADEIRTVMTRGGPPLATAATLSEGELAELCEKVMSFVRDAEDRERPDAVRPTRTA